MHSDHRLALEAQQAGADGFVFKENTLEKLVTAIVLWYQQVTPSIDGEALWLCQLNLMMG